MFSLLCSLRENQIVSWNNQGGKKKNELLPRNVHHEGLNLIKFSYHQLNKLDRKKKKKKQPWEQEQIFLCKTEAALIARQQRLVDSR